MKAFAAAAAVAMTLAASPQLLAQTTPSPTAPTAPSSSAQPQWYTHQANEMRASKLIGSAVKNSAGETIGDINEIVLNKDGRVVAAILGVGGFLGMGEREVAVAFDSLRLVHDANNNTVVTLNTTKDMLKAAPEWRWLSESRTGTTGTGTAPAPGPKK